jgi:hypothetical protein
VVDRATLAKRIASCLASLWFQTPPATARVADTERAEALAARAVSLAASDAAQALTLARQALALTADFEPTAFVKAGRKGEVVEDAYLAARAEYRRHRARLYEAVGRGLAAAGKHVEAARYLRRAVDLDPARGAAAALARSLADSGRGREALDVLLARAPAELSPEALAAAAAAVDAEALPSVQLELDRGRIAGNPVKPPLEPLDGPLRVAARSRLSTGEPLRLDAEGFAVFYVAEASCRTCSADLTALQRLLPEGQVPRLVPLGPEQDRALRQVVTLYKLRWPYVLGHEQEGFLGISGPAAVVVGRRGWSGGVARPPLETTLPPLLAALGRVDLAEPLPRPGWNGRPPERKAAAPRPGLLATGLAPGEDAPEPPEFTAAVDAFAAGKPAEALRAFEALEARGDGWLLPPEARLDRALCLAALGRREAARDLLLHTGDSRFQEAVDRALESVSAGKRP